MLRRRHQPALHRIIVEVLEFLKHDRVARDGLRVHALLPNLMVTRSFVFGPIEPKLVQQPATTIRVQLPQQFVGGEFLKVGDRARQFGPGEDGVEMIIEDNPRVDFQSFVLPAIEQ